MTKGDVIRVALVLLVVQCLLVMYGFVHYQQCYEAQNITRIAAQQTGNETRQDVNILVPTPQPIKKEEEPQPVKNEPELKSELRKKMEFLMEPQKDLNDACSQNTCNESKDIRWRMVSFIKSKADHFAAREALRRTWASVRIVNNTAFRTIFVVGKDPSHANTLKNEQQRFGDILQFDGPDDYRNIMLKTLAGMQWASDNLPRHFFYSSGDDDVIVDVGALQRQIDAAQAKMNKGGWSEYPLVCAYNIMPHDAPHREKGSKWLIDKSEYPWHVWPPSCFGGFYSTRVSLVARLYKESRGLPLLRFDDVWLTGIARQHVGMPSDMVLPPDDAKTVHHLNRNENMDVLWGKLLPELKSHNICLCK